jgi:hypothetical protein
MINEDKNKPKIMVITKPISILKKNDEILIKTKKVRLNEKKDCFLPFSKLLKKSLRDLQNFSFGNFSPKLSVVDKKFVRIVYISIMFVR